MVTIQVNTPVRSIAMLQRRLHPWQVGWRTYAACRGKDLSCGTTRFNRLHLQVQWHAANRRSVSGGHNRRKPAGKGAKRPPPKGGQPSTHWHSKVPNSKQSGVSSWSMKRCTVAKGDRLHARPV